jgi:hypothetical protein
MLIRFLRLVSSYLTIHYPLFTIHYPYSITHHLGFGTENFCECPAFGAAQGAGFGNPHAIAFFTLVVFVVNLVFFGSDNYFPVFGVGGTVFDRDHCGFLHFVADNDANSFFDCHFVLVACGYFVLTGLNLGGFTLVFHGQ